MKVLIIEDEVPAAEKLERYLKRYDDSIEVAEKLNSVSSSSAWLDQNQNTVDLIFMDIQLLDGKSFEIFDNVKITKQIIFITAFDGKAWADEGYSGWKWRKPATGYKFNAHPTTAKYIIEPIHG